MYIKRNFAIFKTHPKMASHSRTRPADQRAPAERAPTAGRAPAKRAPVQRAPVHRAPPEEEYINIHDIDTASSEDENTPAPVPAPAKARATRPGGSNTLDEVTTCVAPIVKPVVKSNRALDIDLLFDRGKGKPVGLQILPVSIVIHCYFDFTSDNS